MATRQSSPFVRLKPVLPPVKITHTQEVASLISDCDGSSRMLLRQLGHRVGHLRAFGVVALFVITNESRHKFGDHSHQLVLASSAFVASQVHVIARKVDASVGVDDGDEVGVDDGDEVGASVGMDDGDEVGASVGVDNGDEVGASVGVDVGDDIEASRIAPPKKK